MTPKKVRALLVAPTKARAKQLASRLASQPLEFDIVSLAKPVPEDVSPYRLLLFDAGPADADPRPYVNGLPATAHVIYLRPRQDLRLIARHLQDPRINHYLGGSGADDQIAPVVQKLVTGSIFGMEHYLPAQASIEYRRFDTFKARCEAIEELETFLREKRARTSVIRPAVAVLEELLMNAMYQALVENGKRVFASVDAKLRIRKRTPRAVSLRFAAHQQGVFICVRDRYGSFERDDLARCLLRCLTAKVQMEQKKLGAGMGLYLIASMVTLLVINILPGKVSEFICMLEPRTAQQAGLSVLSVTTQRSHSEPAEGVSR